MIEAGFSEPVRRDHLEGQTVFVDDQVPRQGTLETALVTSPYARAAVTRREFARALEVPGVRRVILAEDIPGTNNLAPEHDDEPLLADHDVAFFGQVVAMVVGESVEACRAGAAALDFAYQPLPPVTGIEEAIAVQSFHSDARTIERGDSSAGLTSSPKRLSSSFHCGGQEHFYLEPQVALAEPDGRGGWRIAYSGEDLSGVQAHVARVLDCPMNRIEVECPRVGGGFAGRQSQSHACASLAVLASYLTGRPVRVRYSREQDMMLTGKRHPLYAEFEIGYDEAGHLLAADVFVYLDGGCSVENSATVLENLLLHLDNAYLIPNLKVAGRICKTNTVSNTLCVGAGAPQAVALAEEMISRLARALGLVPEVLRQRNLYQVVPEGGDVELGRSHYGQDLPVKRLQTVWRQAISSAEFPARRKGIDLWNSKSKYLRRGLAVVPVKFGVGSLDSSLAQSTSLIQAFTDGSLRVSFGGVDAGEGISIAVAEAVADELGVAAEKIRASGGDTMLAPNTPIGSGIEADLAAEAARVACRQLKARLTVLAAQMLQVRGAQVTVMDDVSFSGGEAFSMESPEIRITFTELIAAAYASRVSLMATGFARSQSVKYDAATGKGVPF
ncbi:MAG: molybdopterin cofactor-binding domain-containing protein, partial [Verrucomicrobiales bacterium]